LQRCWSLRDHATPALQARIAALRASYHLRLGEPEAAQRWLDCGEDLLRESDLEPLELARERTSLLFDRGETWLLIGDYAQAQAVFSEMLAEGETSGWQRSIVHAQGWLAYTALLQNDLDACWEHLCAGWPIASRVKEKRLIAYFKRNFAYYYQARGEMGETRKWAEDALDTFERLGMPPDIREMQRFIAELNSSG
jgi:tetratricopeptide (TPR) repeat protein